jgi:hypothetical protein
LSDVDRQYLEQEAAEMGLSLSDYMRAKLKGSSQLDRIEKKVDEIKAAITQK